MSLAQRPPIKIDEVEAFFGKHDRLLDPSYVKQLPPSVQDRIGNYRDLISKDYRIEFYFVSTGRDHNGDAQAEAERCTVAGENQEFGVTFNVLDFSRLKEFFVEAKTLEQSIPDKVTFTLPQGKWFEVTSHDIP